MRIHPIFLSFLLIVLLVNPAFAQLKVDITRGNINPLPIAITEPTSENNDSKALELGRNIMGVVEADLERSGLFRPIDRNAFIEGIADGNLIPKFSNWRQINASALVTGVVSRQGDKLKIGFRLWDSNAERQVAGKEFNTFGSNWRRVAHLIADEIYKRLTGEQGYFDSRIVYIAESGPAKRRTKRLAIMDQDGANHKFLTSGRHLVLTPRFSPTSQDILYLSYAGRQPRVFLRDLQTGKEESLGRFEGMSFSPRFAPVGNAVVMSIANRGNTEIYSMNLDTRKLTRLTNNPAIDTSPSFSPDAKKIVFNSDRGGSQQLYTMNVDGSNVKRISFGEGRYGTPIWSPRGDLIAFTKIHRGKFFIGVMRSDGSGERLLTESYLDEGPTWAPNGRVIMFTRETPPYKGRSGKSSLYSVDVTGYNLREVKTPIDASDPAWSPLLPL